ncbi:hemolymph lipopolysaccharide-binding protein-like [Augochlora pura]
MKTFSLMFLATALIGVFCGDSSSGQTENSNEEIKETSLSSQQPGGKICCTPTLGRNDYIVTPGLGAHKIHKREMSWNDARLVCLMEGAHLAVVDSARKMDLFKDLMQKESVRTVWLGFHDLFKEGSWTTVTGELVDTLNYQPWAKYQPNNWNNEQHCAFLWERETKGIGAHDGPCAKNYSAVCEINLCASQNPSQNPSQFLPTYIE